MDNITLVAIAAVALIVAGAALYISSARGSAASGQPSTSYTTSIKSSASSQASVPEYQKLAVGKASTFLDQFNVILTSVNGTGSAAEGIFNISTGPYSRVQGIAAGQYASFGQNGTGPFFLVERVNGTGLSGWAAVNMSPTLPAGFSPANYSYGQGGHNYTKGANYTIGNYSPNASVSTYSIAENLSSCQNESYLTALPTNLSSIRNITPLGNLNPAGGHPIPSDHGGITLPANGTSSVASTVYAPGDVHVLQVTFQNATINGKHTSDYAIYFAPCKQLVFYYGHVKTISSALQQQLDKAQPSASCQSISGSYTSSTCTYTFDYLAHAGEVLGTAGGPGSNISGFDFGGYDLRTPAQAFIDPTRQVNNFGRPVHAICPVDYFTPSLQAVLYPKISNAQKGQNGYPSCGTDMQDLAGTIQGNWYLNGSSPTGEQNWSDELSIVHYFEDPSIGAISFGGTIAQASLNTFNPTSSGYVNREPSQVTADGRLYCYYQDNTNTSYGPSPLIGGHFVVQLMDSNTLKIEYQAGPCPSGPSFSNPLTYVR